MYGRWCRIQENQMMMKGKAAREVENVNRAEGTFRPTAKTHPRSEIKCVRLDICIYPAGVGRYPRRRRRSPSHGGMHYGKTNVNTNWLNCNVEFRAFHFHIARRCLTTKVLHYYCKQLRKERAKITNIKQYVFEFEEFLTTELSLVDNWRVHSQFEAHPYKDAKIIEWYSRSL